MSDEQTTQTTHGEDSAKFMQTHTTAFLSRSATDAMYRYLDSACLSSVLSCSFNSKVRNLLASGDSNGLVHIWRLPLDMVRGERKEIDGFKSFWDGMYDDDADEYE